MAGMDLSLRRHDRGISVFWMILASGAAVFVILAVLVLSAGGDSELALEGAENADRVMIEGDAGEAAGELPAGGEMDAATAAEQGGTAAGDPAAAEVAVPTGETATGEAAVTTNPVAAAGEPLPAETVAVPAEVGSTEAANEALGREPEPGAIPAEGNPALTTGDAQNPGPEAGDTVTPTISGPAGADDNALTPD